MTRIAILGPGLLGGSIALAARRAGEFHVGVWARRTEAVEEVKKLGLADLVSTDLRAVVAGAQLVILCVPVGAMPAIAGQIGDAVEPGAIVTDVGSVKAAVVAELSEIFRAAGSAHFVGSHPMAGSEQTGMHAARVDLFDGATCILTPDENTNALALGRLHQFWEELGCQVVETSPLDHDRIVALISHFPHLLAATLVNMVGEKNAAAFDFSGPGFRDATRVAGGPPAMWAEILRSNHTAVRAAAEAMIEKLREITTLLDHEASMTEFLTQAKSQRDLLRLPKTPHA
jgi:prephenate dehydrogenase